MKHSITTQDFKKILFNSKSLPVGDLLFYYKEHKPGISFIVSKKLGNAVLRNKFKRRCRMLFFQKNKEYDKTLQIIVRPQKKIENNYSWDELTSTFDEFYIKLEQ